ncbi:MAG: YigZ family protein, partial [bacterium]|nr:YigZ family protein [bacterium]
FNDDGEPSGSAGKPILSVIQGNNLTNVLVVITRYFGGVKLGKGGLVRAYSECTRQVLNNCNIERCYLLQQLRLKFDYPFTGAVMRAISQFDAKVIGATYGNYTELQLHSPKKFIDELTQILIHETSGKIEITLSEN